MKDLLITGILSMLALGLQAGEINPKTWKPVAQPNLQQEMDAAKKIKLQTVKGKFHGDTCWTGPEWWCQNPDGETWDVMHFYRPKYIDKQELFIFDFKTGKLTKQFIKYGDFHLQPIFPYGAKLFLWSINSLWCYDAASNIMKDTGVNLGTRPGPSLLTTDGQLVTWTNKKLDGGHRMAFNSIDLKTQKFREISIAPYAKKDNFRMRYGEIYLQGDWVYAEAGNNPWVLIGCNYKTGKSKLIVETENIHGDYSTIHLGRSHKLKNIPGLILNVKDLKGHKGKSSSFWLRDGKLTPKTDNVPPWTDKLKKTGHVAKRTSHKAPKDIELKRYPPTSEGLVRVWYRLKGKALEHAQSWATDEVKKGGWGFYEYNITYYPTVFSIKPLPGNKLLILSPSYGRAHIGDPIAGTTELLGQTMSIKSGTLHNGKAYFVGYPNSYVWEYDPGKPWTVGDLDVTKPPVKGEKILNGNEASLETNPRLLGQLHKVSRTQTATGGAVVAADGRFYCGGTVFRKGNGGGFGWLDIKTREFGGYPKVFSAYRPAKMCTADKGRYVVVSTVPAPYDDFNPDFKPKRGMIFIFDTKTHKFIHKVEDKEWYWPGGIADVGNGLIIGWAGRTAKGKGPGYLYGLNVKTGKILWRKDVPCRPGISSRFKQQGVMQAPDGRIWAKFGRVWVRIHPENARVEVVGKPNLKGGIVWTEDGKGYSPLNWDHHRNKTGLGRWPEEWDSKKKDN